MRSVGSTDSGPFQQGCKTKAKSFKQNIGSNTILNISENAHRMHNPEATYYFFPFCVRTEMLTVIICFFTGSS